MENISQLTTEEINENTINIDRISTLEMVKKINDEDQKVALAIKKELPNIAKAIDLMSDRFQEGGRIIYAGAGTSGRLGVLDAVELKPTYNVDSLRAIAILAGGENAMFDAVEGAEDSKDLALEDLKKINLCEKDTLIGIAASGRTPYVISALEYANKVHALSIALTCNGNSVMSKIAKISISPIVGPEVISGSTRMKAGTAQKMVLNMLSTGTMIKVGKVYHNYMINMLPTNEKLKNRALNMLSNILHIDLEEADKKLRMAHNDIAVAIIMHEAMVKYSIAKQMLLKAKGNVMEAINISDDL